MAHRLSGIDGRTATCSECGPTTLVSAGSGRLRCTTAKAKYRGDRGHNQGKHHYRRFKTEHCACCGFRAFDPCQLDVHHIDGDHRNSDPSNLTTLCANCHRLATHAPAIYGRLKALC